MFKNNKVKQLNDICPICQTKDGTILGNLKYTLFDGDSLNDNYDVVCCVKCGFVFCDTLSSQIDYDNFYEKSFHSSEYIKHEIGIDEKMYLEYISKILSVYVTNKDTSIFDIGCGKGSLLKTLHELNYKNLYGIDPSISCIDMLNEYDGIRSKIGSISNIPFDDIKANIIILSHVMEHVIDLPLILKNINDKLSDNGLVYVEVPNAVKYDEFNKNTPLRYFYFQHVVHFDQFHLCTLFELNGYQKIDSGYHTRVENSLLMPCTWGIFRKSDIPPNKNKIIKDFELAGIVKKWFDNVLLDNNDILAKIASDNVSVYVWGIGTHSQMMLSMSPLKDCNIKCFIDNDERNQRKTINGKEICSVDILYNATEQDVVFIGAPTHSKKMYIQLIEEIGFKGQVVILDFENISLLK